MALHAALGDPIRLAVVDEVTLSDRSPAELTAKLGIPSNLLAHHVELLVHAGIVSRTASGGDRRRRYIQLVPDVLAELVAAPHRRLPARRLVFVCTANSARSQFAQALWRERRPDIPATSGGTHPAERVNPRAVQAAERAGLGLGDSVPQAVPELHEGDLVVTVCDRAYEGMAAPPARATQPSPSRPLQPAPARSGRPRPLLPGERPGPATLHWAVPDPVDDGDFDSALTQVRRRVDSLARHVSPARAPNDPTRTRTEGER